MIQDFGITFDKIAGLSRCSFGLKIITDNDRNVDDISGHFFSHFSLLPTEDYYFQL